MATYGIYQPINIKGEKGEIGLQGPRGENGFEGIPGRNGLNGGEGKQGKQGFKGDIGPLGNHGPEGPVGEPGEKGDLGSTGIYGPTGVTGPVGSNKNNFKMVYSAYSLKSYLSSKAWRQDDVDVNYDYNINTNYNINNKGYAFMMEPGNNQSEFLDKSLMNFDTGENFNKLVQLGLDSNYFIPLGNVVTETGIINGAYVSIISDSVNISKPNELVHTTNPNMFIGYRISIEIHSPYGTIDGTTDTSTWTKYTRKRTYLHDSVENKLQTNIQFIKTTNVFTGYPNLSTNNDNSLFDFTSIAELGITHKHVSQINVYKNDIICVGFTPIYADKSNEFKGVNPKNQIIRNEWNNHLKLKKINIDLNMIKI